MAFEDKFPIGSVVQVKVDAGITNQGMIGTVIAYKDYLTNRPNADSQWVFVQFDPETYNGHKPEYLTLISLPWSGICAQCENTSSEDDYLCGSCRAGIITA